MAIQIVIYSTQQTIFFNIESETTGAPLTGLTWDSAGLTAYYIKTGSFPVQIALATVAVNSYWTEGGFVEVDAVNMPGIYRLDIPDEISNDPYVSVPIRLQGAADMKPVTEVVNIFHNDGLLTETVDGTFSLIDYLVIIGSAAAGKISGAEGTEIVLRDIFDTYDVLHATVDANGNRTNVVFYP